MASLNLLPKKIDDFQSVEYWDNFFTQLHETTFEWYGETDDVWQVLQHYITKDDVILHVGNGNSNIIQDLYQLHSFTKAEAIDISQVAVDEMRIKSKHMEGLKFTLMDVTAMTYESDSFDHVMDKAVFDAMMHDSSEETTAMALKMAGEIDRVLKPSTSIKSHYYFSVSLAQTHILELFLSIIKKYNWSVEIKAIYPKSTGSELLPFLFIFTMDGANKVTVHLSEGPVSDTNVSIDWIEGHMNTLRKAFAERIKQLKQRTLVVIHVKPWEAETDLSLVADKIRAMDWDGVTWTDQKIVPIGFGIH
eukprot:Ihof_evm2s816 gene=Ihof_evmTU2s816